MTGPLCNRKRNRRCRSNRRPRSASDVGTNRPRVAGKARQRVSTLRLQGEGDTTDTIGQSQQLYRGLKAYGVKTELVLYPRDGHVFTEEKHVLDVYKRIVE